MIALIGAVVVAAIAAVSTIYANRPPYHKLEKALALRDRVAALDPEKARHGAAFRWDQHCIDLVTAISYRRPSRLRRARSMGVAVAAFAAFVVGAVLVGASGSSAVAAAGGMALFIVGGLGVGIAVPYVATQNKSERERWGELRWRVRRDCQMRRRIDSTTGFQRIGYLMYYKVIYPNRRTGRARRKMRMNKRFSSASSGDVLRRN